jgi:hypothetical protein
LNMEGVATERLVPQLLLTDMIQQSNVGIG